MNNKKNEIYLAISFLFTYIAMALPIGYIQTYLAFLGYDATERGWMFAAGAITTMIFQFIAGYCCDVLKSDKKIFNVTMLLIIIATYITFNYTEKIFFFHLLFVAVVIGLNRTVFVVQDTWCIETQESTKRNFGPIRSLGSIGWMIGNTLGAYLIVNIGYHSIGLVFCILGVINVLFTMVMQDAQKVADNDQRITLNSLKALFKNRKYTLIVFIFLVINIIAAADIYTVVDKMIAIGADEVLIGQRQTFQAFSELPLFFLGTVLIKKFGDYKLMLFGTIMFIVKFIAYSYVDTPQLMILVALLQGLTYPLTMITSKTMVDANTPSMMRSSGQAVASAVYVGGSLLITPILSSLLSSTIGIDNTLRFFAASGFIAVYLAYWYQKS